MNDYKPLGGRNGKRSKNSKAMECAVRYLVEEDRWMTADEIYHNMTYRNGRLYRNARHTIHFNSFAAKLMRMKELRQRKENTRSVIMYKTDKNTYEQLFPIDPMLISRGDLRPRDKNMRWTNANKT